MRNEVAPFVPFETFKIRDVHEEMLALYEFLTRGIDNEDVGYLRNSYESLLQDDANR